MSRLLSILIFCLIVGCQSLTEKDVSTDEQVITETPVRTPLSKTEIQSYEAAFEVFLSKVVDQRIIDAEDKEMLAVVHRFFPNTSRFQNHHVSIEPIAARDSFWLLLYELIAEEEERSQLFLGSFRKTGHVIDLLEIQSVSFDGHLSLNLLDGDILEMEYHDFTIRPGFPNLQANMNDYSPQVLPVSGNRGQTYAGKNSGSETSGTRYFHIKSDGVFVALASENQKDIERVFPQVSSRILSIEELERLKPDELELMRKELYNCHGFIHEDVLLDNFFTEKGWCLPDSMLSINNLSEIEQINLERMLNLSGVWKAK